MILLTFLTKEFFIGDWPMTPFRTQIALLLLVAALLLAAGCAGQTGERNTPAINPSIPTPATSLQHPNQSICPSSDGNVLPFIIINPIDKHYRGESFEINGTTNLGEGEKIYYYIDRPQEPVPVGQPEPDLKVAEGSVPVESGCPVQQWRLIYNSTQYYSAVNGMSVHAMNMTVNNYTDFVVRIPFVEIDPLGDYTAGDVIQINGSTNLDPGKKIRIDIEEIPPAPVSGNSSQSTNCSYSRGFVTFLSNNPITNYWIYPVNLSGFHENSWYSVNVSYNDTQLSVRPRTTPRFYVWGSLPTGSGNGLNRR